MSNVRVFVDQLGIILLVGLSSLGGNCPVCEFAEWEISGWSEVRAVVVYVRIVLVEDIHSSQISYSRMSKDRKCAKVATAMWCLSEWHIFTWFQSELLYQII